MEWKLLLPSARNTVLSVWYLVRASRVPLQYVPGSSYAILLLVCSLSHHVQHELQHRSLKKTALKKRPNKESYARSSIIACRVCFVTRQFAALNANAALSWASNPYSDR